MTDYTAARHILEHVAFNVREFLENRSVKVKSYPDQLPSYIEFIDANNRSRRLAASGVLQIKWDDEVVWSCYDGDEHLPISAYQYIAALVKSEMLGTPFVRRTVKGYGG